MKKILIAAIAALVITPFNVMAYQCPTTIPYYSDKERGWFYREDCTPKEKSEEEHTEEKKYKTLPSKEVVIPWDVMDDLDPDEIQKIQTESVKTAIMYPSDANVKEYERLMRWIMKKSRSYADAGVKLRRTDPEFAMNTVSQGSMTAKDILLSYKQKGRDNVFAELRDRAAIAVVVKKGCPYCEGQMPILKSFHEEYGWDVSVIDVDEKPNTARRLGTQQTPDIFIVLNRDNELIWQRIGSGYHTLDVLKDAVIYGLSILGEVQDEKLISN